MQKNKQENIVRAVSRNVRTSPRKVNNLLKNIRGKKADLVIRDLSFARKRIAFDIKKTVQSAIANAENNFQYDIDNLYIKEAYVGKSLVLKRVTHKTTFVPCECASFIKSTTGQPCRLVSPPVADASTLK